MFFKIIVLVDHNEENFVLDFKRLSGIDGPQFV